MAWPLAEDFLRLPFGRLDHEARSIVVWIFALIHNIGEFRFDLIPCTNTVSAKSISIIGSNSAESISIGCSTSIIGSLFATMQLSAVLRLRLHLEPHFYVQGSGSTYFTYPHTPFPLPHRIDWIGWK